MTKRFICLVCLLGLAAVQGAQAQDQRAAREREMLRRLQQANQALTQEKTDMLMQNAKLERELDGARSALDGAERSLRRSEATARALRAELERAALERAELAAKLAETERAYLALDRRAQETALALGEAQQDKRRLQSQLEGQREIIARQAQAMQALNEKNEALYRAGAELLERYRNAGLGDALLRAEPITGIRRAEIDNLWQDYRDRLEDQKSGPTH